jgi:hypothetical protein
LAGAVALVTLGGGCAQPAPQGPEAPRAKADEALGIRAHTCSKCHAPPEAGKHTRAELEVIFIRHRTRARLTPEQWAAMVDLLAQPDETPGPR